MALLLPKTGYPCPSSPHAFFAHPVPFGATPPGRGWLPRITDTDCVAHPLLGGAGVGNRYGVWKKVGTGAFAIERKHLTA